MPDRRRVTALVLALRFVVALLAFAGAAAWSARSRPGGMPVWVVVLTMAAVGAVFALTAGPLTRVAERAVLRDRADGYQAGHALLRRMSTALPVEDVLPSLAETTGRTLQVDRSEVRVLLDGGQTLSQVWPERAGAQGAPVVVQVRHDGDTVGEIEADVTRTAGGRREAALLRQLAGPAGLAMSTVRLTAELQRRAASLTRLNDQIAVSNRRIGQARQHESDAITAEIRARVDPCLDAAADLIESALLTPADAPVLIDQAREQVAQGLAELRNLARRIYPPRLADGGLAAALEGWQLRAGVGVDLAIEDDSRLRADPAVESCVYFLLVAALEHRPAAGRRQSVTVAVNADRVEVQVDVPMPDPARQNANRSIDQATVAAVTDRVEAFGGSITVTVADGRRTLRAWLPLGQEGRPE